MTHDFVIKFILLFYNSFTFFAKWVSKWETRLSSTTVGHVYYNPPCVLSDKIFYSVTVFKYVLVVVYWPCS